MSGKAVLCVDDEAILLLSMKQELKSHFHDRFRFETATDAEKALASLAELAAKGIEVILIISDWLMPGMKGDEFLLEARRRYPDIQSIMVTGHADPASMKDMLKEAKTRTILRKPWKNEDLISAVSDCVD
jgi:DNA-binding NtrC family response regulator